VLLFASYADVIGQDRIELDVPDQATVADVVAAVRSTHRSARLPPRPLVAVNRRYAAYDAPVGTGDEIAVIPPVAGG